MELQTIFAYNSLNLLEKVVRNDTIVAKYTYLWDGTKLAAVNGDDCGFAYRGSFTYHLGSDDPAAEDFESVPFGGGRIVATSGNATEVRYFLTDHLGSVRVVATDKDNVFERNDYQPFGKRWNTASMPVADNRDRFNGKEDQAFTGLPFSDYGARMYDPERGRWFTQDPKAEDYLSVSQYCFCGNNPIIFIDPNGKSTYQVTKNGDFILLQYKKESKDTYIALSNNNVVQKVSVSNKIMNSFQYMLDVESIYPTIKVNIASKYESSDSQELKNLFEFVSQNTEVEWSFMSIVLSNGTKAYLLTTSHKKSNERSAMIWANEKHPSAILKHIHNHPGGNSPSIKDLENTKELPNTTFYIYRYNQETDTWEYEEYEEKRFVID